MLLITDKVLINGYQQERKRSSGKAGGFKNKILTEISHMISSIFKISIAVEGSVKSVKFKKLILNQLILHVMRMHQKIK